MSSVDADLILEPGPETTVEQVVSEEEPETELAPADIFSEILKEFNKIYAAVYEQSDETYESMQELKAEVLAQGIFLTQLDTQSKQQQEMLNRSVQNTKGVPDQLQALTEPIQQLQAQQNAQVQSSRRESRKSHGPTRFSTRVVLLLMLGQSMLVAIATALAIHYFPPDPSIKSQQQSLAIFQRLDRLYKEKFGNSLSK